MKTLVGRTGSWLAVVAVVLLLGVAPVWAGSFTIDHWNVDEFNTAGASLTINVALVGGNTQITFIFNPGTLTNVLIGLDMFAYDGSNALSGLDGFALAKGVQMNGFGSYDRKYTDGGHLGLPTFVITGDHVGDFTLADQFAAHLRFASATSCSGFVGGHDPNDTKSEAGCGVNVAEPAILALAGFGFVGLGLVSRRWRKK